MSDSYYLVIFYTPHFAWQCYKVLACLVISGRNETVGEYTHTKFCYGKGILSMVMFDT